MVSAIGSVYDVAFSTVTLDRFGKVGRSDPIRLDDAVELVGLQGQFGRDGTQRPQFHLHGMFALADGRVVGGHLFAARVLATVEVVLGFGEIGWFAHPLEPGRDDLLVFEPVRAESSRLDGKDRV